VTSVNLAGSYVALGDVRPALCLDCGDLREEQAVIAMTDAGVIQLGLMIGGAGLNACDCGVLWLCSLCPARVPMDGSSPWQHVRENHARITV